MKISDFDWASVFEAVARAHAVLGNIKSASIISRWRRRLVNRLKRLRPCICGIGTENDSIKINFHACGGSGNRILFECDGCTKREITHGKTFDVHAVRTSAKYSFEYEYFDYLKCRKNFEKKVDSLQERR